MKLNTIVIIICLNVQLIYGGHKLANWPTLDGIPPKLMGHCGERFYLPEHTVGAYELAAIEGADYVEPDLVLTKDGILVCYHDLALSRVTDIDEHPEFAHLKGNHSVVVDGKNATIYDDWLVIDFTLAELKTLRVKQQPNGVRLQYFNELFSIATFQEFLDAIHRISFKLGKPIGIIPELKQPLFHNIVFNQKDHFMETEFLDSLRNNGYPLLPDEVPRCQASLDNSTFENITCGPIIFQNFDKDSLKFLSTQTNVELMMLVHPNVYLLTPQGFSEIANFSDYVCLWKEYLYTGVEAEVAFRGWEYDASLVETLGGFLEADKFVPEAHRLGLKMAIFTIPDSRESSGRGCAIQCDPVVDRQVEMFYYFEMGVDAMFVENIPEATNLRMKFDYELKLQNLSFTKDNLII